MKKIVNRILNVWQSNKASVLISIIDKSGSTPRGVGTQMLVDEAGVITGTIGGGAVEKEAIDLAKSSLSTRKSFTKNFDLNMKDSSLNMVCGGVLFLHFLYVDRALFEKEITTIDSKINSREPGFMVIDTVDNKLSYSSSAIISTNTVSIPLPVPDKVYIFGTGHVAQALVPVLSNIGFSCTIIDNRAEFIDKSLFPEAEDVILGDYENIESNVSLTAKDYLIIMTHGHTHDYTVLEQVLSKKQTYIGVMGSRRKREFVNSKLRLNGFTEEQIESIHAPIGLSIDAVTPEEIAISVAAELISVRANLRGNVRVNACDKKCPSL